MCLRMPPSGARGWALEKAFSQSGAGGKLLAWGWRRDGSWDGELHCPCQELGEGSQPGNLQEPKCFQKQLLL